MSNTAIKAKKVDGMDWLFSPVKAKAPEFNGILSLEVGETMELTIECGAERLRVQKSLSLLGKRSGRRFRSRTNGNALYVNRVV